MPRYFIQLAFDGTDYHGWQAQPNGATVQQRLEQVLSTLLKQEISVTGAGRTDTGVHASFFMAHFDLINTKSFKTDSLIFRLNRFLPPDIVVYRIQKVPDHLHARFSALYRTYNYHISTFKPLYKRNYSHYIFGQLDVEKINRCCEILMGTTDFTSFSKLHSNVKTNNCRIFHAEWKEVDKGYLFEIKADRFLRNMVRSIVGTLLDVGQGKINEHDFRNILEARDRRKAGQSVPAKGLFLVDIGYENSLNGTVPH